MAETNTIANLDNISSLAYNDVFATDDLNDLDIFGAPITKNVTALQMFQYITRAGGVPTTLEDCVTATTANLTSTYSNGTLGEGATLTNSSTQAALVIDGRTMGLNERVLVWQQSAQEQNGVYIVTNVGSASTNWVLTRATDFDTSADMDLGTCVSVLGGSTLIGSTFIMYTASAITVGTTGVIWRLYSSVMVSANNAFSVSGTGNLIATISALTTATFPSGTYTLAAQSAANTFGAITFTNGAGIRTGITASDTALLAAYDVDNTIYRTFGTLTAGNTPSLALSAPAGGAMTLDNCSIGSVTPASAVFTTITSDSQTFNTGTGLKTATSNGNTYGFSAYDVDGAIHKTFATATAANTPTFAWSQPAGATLTWDGGAIGSTTKASGGFTTLTTTGLCTHSVGSGSATVNQSGSLFLNTTPVSNVGAGEDTLMTNDVAANTLTTTGSYIEWEVAGTNANNVNSKVVKVYFGTTLLLTLTQPASVASGWWRAKVTIVRTGSNAQTYIVEAGRISATGATTMSNTSGTCNETETAAITLKCTGEAVSDADITQTKSTTKFYGG